MSRHSSLAQLFRCEKRESTRSRCLLLAALVLAWPLAIASSARAREEAQAHLSWRRPVPSMCPPTAALIADVEALSGRKVFVDRQDAQLLVFGVVEELIDGVRARIEVRERDGRLVGTRELRRDDQDCAALRGALALVLTLLLEQPVAAHAASKAHGMRALSLHGGVHAGMLAGLLPLTTSGIGASLGLSPLRRLRVGVQASYWLPVIMDGAADIRVRLTVWQAGIDACPRVLGSERAFALFACSALLTGAQHAAARGLAGPPRLARLFAGVELGLAAMLPFTARTAFWLFAGGVRPLLRPRFYYERADGVSSDVQRSSAFGGVVRLAFIIGGR